MPDYRVRQILRLAHASGVQRLFSTFPRGFPGLALLLARASVAIALLLEWYRYEQDLSDWLSATAIVSTAALAIGGLTPLAAVAALVCHALIWRIVGLHSVAIASTVILDAISLALLGPGAYSLDGHLFGRRAVVLPRP